MLYKGDCLIEMDKIPDGSVDMICADPPYGTTACKWDAIIPLEPMWRQLKRVIKPNGAIVMTASQPFTTTLISSNMKMFKYCWVWSKSRATLFQHAKRMPMRKHEDVCVWYKKQPTYNPQFDKGKPYTDNRTTRKIPSGILGGDKTAKIKIPVNNTGTRYPTTLSLTGFFENKGNQHPTQKPVALMEYLIKTYTNEGETVLDFAAGSFTTGVACVNQNRQFIGIEKDDKYYEVAKKRIKEAKDSMGLFKMVIESEAK